VLDYNEVLTVVTKCTDISVYGSHSAPGCGLIFVRLRKDAEALAQFLAARPGAGHVEWVTGDRPEKERSAIAERMRTGEVQIAVATDAWRDGINIPNLRWVVLESWSKAPIGVIQKVGRGTRLAQGKPHFSIHVLPGTYAKEIRSVLLGAGYNVASPAPDSYSVEDISTLFERRPKTNKKKEARARELGITSIREPESLVGISSDLGRRALRTSRGLDNLWFYLLIVVLATLGFCVRR